ncbi:uncharacterized protein LAJ45_07713 [Morchella importuna]|uniref:uncharacterized protein n=1 Tax=Morchella importuna TaxID=1174673 RepID=UPI001E8ED408|nr:uncharacterized protein LAJ45_07713 [Morchella importuna]KAH8148261.1 hypothetical protein LAJ45_07713 [Morchella importuna]
MGDRRAFRTLMYHGEEALHLLRNVQPQNDIEPQVFEEFLKLLQEIKLAATQAAAGFCNGDDLLENQGGVGERSQKNVDQPFLRASAAPQEPLVQEVPARKVYGAYVQQPFLKGWLENPRPAPAPPGLQRGPIIRSNSPSLQLVIDPTHCGEPAPAPPGLQRDPIIRTRSTSMVIDPPRWRQPAPQREIAVGENGALAGLGQNQPRVAFGVLRAEGRFPAALGLLPRYQHSAAPPELSSFAAGDSFATRSGEGFRRRWDIDEDPYWEYANEDEAESANRAGGAVDAADDAEESTGSEEEKEEGKVGWNTRPRVCAGPCRYF